MTWLGSLNLIILVWEVARILPLPTCRQGSRGPDTAEKSPPQPLPSEPCRPGGHQEARSGPPLPSSSPASGAAGPYLILPFHTLCPGVQALNGVHSILRGHLPPVPALWHMVPLLSLAAGGKG